MEKLRIVVEPEAAGTRVDRLVMERVPTTRMEARELCRSGAVRLDGRRVNKGARASAGATLEIELPSLAAVLPEPELALDVRLLRDDLVVVHKPAGMATVPIERGERGTLASALIAGFPEMVGVGHRPREPGVLHRLDTQTSGLVVAARNAETFERLHRGLSEGHFDKRYLAVCEAEGLAPEGRIDVPLTPDKEHYGRVIEAPPGTYYRHESVTHFRVLEAGSRFALVELRVSRAFRHQIRAHLSLIGHPIVGDSLYGGPIDERLGERHALHASYVAWAGDRTPAFNVEASAPRVFLELTRETSEA